VSFAVGPDLLLNKNIMGYKFQSPVDQLYSEHLPLTGDMCSANLGANFDFEYEFSRLPNLPCGLHLYWWLDRVVVSSKDSSSSSILKDMITGNTNHLGGMRLPWVVYIGYTRHRRSDSQRGVGLYWHRYL